VASTTWDELPAPLKTAIERHTGPVARASAGGEGASTSVRLVLHAEGGEVFIKGTAPDAPGHLRQRLTLGAALAPYVTAVSPPLLWHVQADGWNVTGWPALPGRPWASHKPGSPDIPRLVTLLTRLAEIPAPAVLTSTAREEWDPYTDTPDAFNGDALCHRDPNPTNFVIGTEGDQAWMVDFGWATRGPAWLTSAQLITSMIESGWKPADAEEALTGIPAWRNAPPEAITAYATAYARMWTAAVARTPTKVRQFRAGIARNWAAYRNGTATH
jgi:hypothetical protein